MILIVGDEILDRYVHLETQREAPDGGHPVVVRSHVEQQAGGAGAVAEMVRALGEHVCLIGRPFANYQIPVKTRYVVDGVTQFREDVEQQCSSLSLDSDVLGSLYPEVVLVADYGKGMITREVIAELLVSFQCPVIVDPCRTCSLETYRGVWAITPNRVENERCDYLRHFDRVCLKLDADGMTAKHGGSIVNMPALCGSVVDPCGAGDQVLATIGVMIARGRPWLEACRLANVAAGLKCGLRGTTPVTEAMLAKHAEAVACR